MMHDPMAQAIKKKRAGLTISIDVSPEGEMKPSAKGSELAPEAPELDEDKAHESAESPAMEAGEKEEALELPMMDDIAADQAMTGRPPKSLSERAAAMHAAKKQQPKQ